MTNCAVCGSVPKLVSRAENGGDWIAYDCSMCGRYKLTRTAAAIIGGLLSEDSLKRAALSHSIRKMQRQIPLAELDSHLLEKIVGTARLPSAGEQADNLLAWLAENTKIAGEPVMVAPSQAQAAIGAGSARGVDYAMNYLLDQGLANGERHRQSVGLGDLVVSVKGWERYEELKRGRIAKRVAFMAMPYGVAELDRLVNDVFRPAVARTGFELRRLDDTPKAGLIDDRLRVEIRNSRFLVVDLTFGNHGAYWEAGYAEGLGKPVIYTCRRDDFESASHFDTNHHLTVLWEENDLQRAANGLVNTIRATLPDEANLTD